MAPLTNEDKILTKKQSKFCKNTAKTEIPWKRANASEEEEEEEDSA